MSETATNPLGNRSHATRAQRIEAHKSLDDFPTPAWSTRALIEHVIGPETVRSMTCWEPAANRGGMVRPLHEYFREVVGTDVHDYGAGFPVVDFLFPGDPRTVDWIITNPPFRLAEQFALKAIATATVGVALLVRTQFLEGRGRFERLFSQYPPAVVAQFVERAPMVKGRLDREASTATAYAWVLWRCRATLTTPRFTWIPPCRAVLDRDSDWPSPLVQQEILL